METAPKSAWQRQDYLLLGVTGMLLLAWNIISWRFPFFWDTVLNAKTATWYLESGFEQLAVPENLDAGHPPFFSLYLAGIWAAFGRSLTVSHLAMLPWLLLLMVQFHRLAMRWLSPKGRIWAMALLLCEPTFLAQAGMVTPDIVLVACYLLALNAVLDGRRALLCLAIIVMASMSFRGILMTGTLLLTDGAWAWWSGNRRLEFRKAWPYALAAVLTGLWLWVHWRAAGWLFAPPEATYGGQRQAVGIAGMARNAALVGWRLMDFGRVFLWGFVAFASLALGWNRIWQSIGMRQVLVALIGVVGGLAALFLPFSNPPGHRYFLVGYLLLVLLAAGLADLGAWNIRWKAGILAVAIGLATGHFWVYPKGVAQGWDASLAHWPVFGLQKKAYGYLADQNVAPREVCADFPFLHDPCQTLLTCDQGSSASWFQNALETPGCPWVIVSNLNNGYTTAQLTDFENPAHWELKAEFHSWQLWLRIYRHR